MGRVLGCDPPQVRGKHRSNLPGEARGCSRHQQRAAHCGGSGVGGNEAGTAASRGRDLYSAPSLGGRAGVVRQQSHHGVAFPPHVYESFIP